MTDFADFLKSDDQTALQPASDFGSFLAGEKQRTLQQAQAVTAGNATQSAATAASAAKLVPQVGLPQAAIETDLPRFQQQATQQKNSSILSDSPVLASWVAAHPDSARVAQEEYDKLSGVEKLWKDLPDYAMAPLKGLAQWGNQRLLAADRVVGDVIGNVSPEASAWWYAHATAHRLEAAPDLQVDPNSLGQQALASAGNMLGTMAEVVLSGGAGEAKVAETSLGALWNSISTAGRSMMAPSLVSAVNTGQDVYDRTGNRLQSMGAAALEYGLTTLQGAAPLSIEGGVLKRLASGAVSGIGTAEIQRQAMNLVLPEEMRQPFDPNQLALNAITGAIMGGVLGPRVEPDMVAAVRQTYTDAYQARVAADAQGRIQGLSSAVEGTKLKESSPGALREFVRSVTDGTSLDAVYVDAKKLGEAFAQSARDIPREIADQMGTGADVRIPIDQYVASISGTPTEKAILPELRASPDGMTFSEAEQHFSNAKEEMTSKAQQLQQRRAQKSEFDQDKATVHQSILDQLNATGRNPEAVNRAYATLVAEHYGAMAQREGMKPSELYAKVPLKVGATKTEGLQQDEQRGSFNPAERTIGLLQHADLSTFLHESGHAFLDTLEKVATGGGSEGAKADLDTLLRHFGEKGETPEERAASWTGKTLDEKRTAHEKFAEGFERYLMEGKAPSETLRTIFGRFRSWLLNVYTKLRGSPIDPEVKGVMDRMLASDEAIRDMEAQHGYKPLFADAKEMGVEQEEFDRYVAQGEAATEAAVSKLQSQSLKDLKWASGAKSKALKALQRQAKQARDEVQRQVEEEVRQYPAFQAKEWMRQNKDQELAASMHGFPSADAMRQAILEAGNEKDIVKAMTDQRMLQEHGELTSPEAMEHAANDAVHNEARARFMATGLKALTKSPLPAGQISRAAKAAAEEMIAKRKTGELRADVYLAAEARANREAVEQAAKSPAKAMEAQRTALLNNRLAKAAMDANDEVMKGLAYLRGITGKGKLIGAEYMDRINELLSQYDVTARAGVTRDLAGRQQFRAWLDSEFARTGVRPQVPDSLLDFAQRKSWRELTVEEFRGLTDAVKSMEHVGREATQVMVAGKKVALDDLVARALEGTKDLPHSEPVDLQPHLLHATGLEKISAKFLALKSKVRGLDAALLKMEQAFQWLTYGKRAGLGEVKSGPYLEMFQRAADAEGLERSMRAESAKDIRALRSTHLKGIDLNQSISVPELPRKGRGAQWYREELISAALNTGNESNLGKLAEGYGWHPDILEHALAKHLSKAEWNFVQGVWGAVGKYGDRISDLQKRQTGVAPEMIKPRKVKNQHGEFAGGYYPVVYDAFQDRSIDLKQQQKTDTLFENQWSQPTTNKGHTIQRTGYKGPIYLSLGVISRHLDQVTHDLAWREPIVDINKFLSHPEIQKDVDQTMGREYTKQFRPWLQAMANDKVFNTSGDSAWENFYRQVRTNATLVGLGFRMSTMMIHGGSALANSIGEVGTKYFAKGAAQFATPERWEQAKRFMYERSPEMAHRFDEWDRNLHEAIDQLNHHRDGLAPMSKAQRALDGARRFAFYGVSALDMGSAAPTWYGAYLKGMAKAKDGGHDMGEDDAIDFANRAVRNAHGGGGTKDLSAVQRDKGVMSLATMFYSYWSHMYNRQRDIGKGYANLGESFKQGTGTRDFAKLLARSWWYFVIPQMIHAALKPTPANQQDDNPIAHMAEELGLGFVSGVPVLRDLVSAAVSGRDYTISPLEQVGKSVVKAAQDGWKLTQGEPVSAHAGKNAMEAAGFVAGLPTGQLSTTGSFLWDVYNGDAQPEDARDWYNGLTSGRLQP